MLVELETAIMHRALDGIEISKLAYTPAYAVNYVGRVDRPALQQAFTQLCERHPVLRARVNVDQDRCTLHVTPESQPETVILEGDEQTLLREISEPCDPRKEMTKLLLIENGADGGSVALRTNHATLDGRHFTAVFTELWQLYTDLVNGNSLRSEPGHLPVSTYALMQDRFEDMVEIPVAQPEELGQRPDYEIFQHVIELNQQQSSVVLQAARSRELTVHALLCSVVIEAQVSAMAVDSEAIPMCCWSPVDLRNRVTPPIKAIDTTNFFAIHQARINYSPSMRWHEIGAAIQNDLKVQLAAKRLSLTDGTLTLGPGRSTDTEDHGGMEPRLTSVGVSNYGVLPPIPTPDSLRIVKFHSIADRIGTPFPTCSAFTFDNSLSIINRYRSDYFTTSEVRTLVNATTARLLDRETLLAP
ncbi:phthiocerol/phthiodiolone dimycocerosyl transferase family protein [Amycolatopsis thermoflava]|uniref:phthiocerol/phthiodiolone dimycocerosyl transferase family protein n=1 Tax=Amycolatopsis thermoflava TaxID=84480 RepID=UPI00365116D8